MTPPRCLTMTILIYYFLRIPQKSEGLATREITQTLINWYKISEISGNLENFKIIKPSIGPYDFGKIWSIEV